MSIARNNEDDLLVLHDQLMAQGKTKWAFLHRSKATGYLGFRAVAGVGSIFDQEWVGDVYVEAEAFHSGKNYWPVFQSSS